MSNTTTTPTTLEQRRDAMVALHEAAASEDWATVLAAYHPDIVWTNDPGAGPWAGRFEGIDALANMFGEYLEFLGGTRFVDGLIVEVITVDLDRDAALEFWGAVSG